MNYRDLIQAVYHEPALITPEAHATIRTLLEARFGSRGSKVEGREQDGDGAQALDSRLSSLDFVAQRSPGRDMCGEKVAVAQMEVIDHVAHIPIGGAIGQKLSGFQRGNGAVDVADIAQEIAQCGADPDIHGILLEIDSPGGMVSGTPELAELLKGVRKTMYAFTDGMMASAAYWLGSTAHAVFATQSAVVGSIGVYLPVLDMSAFYETRGVKVELIKAGKLKGIGFPGTPLTESAREHLQEQVNQIYSMFTTHVRAQRGPWITDATMQGQTFLGAGAREAGLVDALVADKWEVHRMLRS